HPRNVLRLGVLSEAEKAVLLSWSNLAVNPLFEGGGSSLKVPDFFAARLPLVSARAGVRGFDVRHAEHYLAADRDSFASAVRRVVADGNLGRRLAENARTFCETYLDWRLLGARYRRALRSTIAPNYNPRVLVVTYRFADPPPGGAESFLVNVLRELARRGTLTVDVAACHVGSIANKWHFSAEYRAAEHGAPDPAYVGGAYRFAVDEPGNGTFEQCRHLFRVWMEESRRQALDLIELYDRPLLLGGWNYPETHTGVSARWTSRTAQILVSRHATAVRIAAVSPQS